MLAALICSYRGGAHRKETFDPNKRASRELFFFWEQRASQWNGLDKSLCHFNVWDVIMTRT